MKNIKCLDGLKGLSILGVLIVHWGNYFYTDNKIFQILISNGAKGVEMFFIIATFLGCMSYSQNVGRSLFEFGGGGGTIING